MQKHIFLFTIAPVQSFIEQARKTHDLFAGSRIISQLITYAMEQVKDKEAEVEFIFPTIEQKSKPNRFIAIINTSDMQQFGNDIQSDVKKYFVTELGKEVINLFPPSKTQLEDFLKTYWVANKYEDKKTTPYPQQIKQLERNLGAVKNIRYFNQFPEKGRKCSMNGEYNVKFYRRGETEDNSDRLYDKKLFQKRNGVKVITNDNYDSGIAQKDLNEGEGLCAVSMLKRLYKKDAPGNGFPSTARIALLDTLQKNKIADNFLEIIKSLNRGYVDEQIYYEANTTEDYFRKHGYRNLLKNSKATAFSGAFEDMKKAIKKQKLKLAKYYAILAFDADSMGKKLQECKGAEEHTRFSERLADFARHAFNYINEEGKSRGKTVYAGGDDFLGFINLNHLFDVMKDLRQLFDEVVNTNLRSELQMTFSAGVAIAHYKTPLSKVLRWAKQMEKSAKNVEKSDETTHKDAFSIAVLKRSGEIHYTTWRWKSEDKWTTDLFKRVIQHIKNKELSKKFISNLSGEFEKRLDKDGHWGKQAKQNGFEDELNDMLKYELGYFIERATASDEDAKKTVKGLTNELYENYEHHLDFKLSVQNLLNMLHISEFITRELNPIEPSKQHS